MSFKSSNFTYSADAPAFVPFSASAPEFVPSSSAPEFVPSFVNDNQANPQHFNPYAGTEMHQYSYGMAPCQVAPMTMNMNQMISLDGYSDDSSDEEQPEMSAPTSKCTPDAPEQRTDVDTACASSCDHAAGADFQENASDISEKEPCGSTCARTTEPDASDTQPESGEEGSDASQHTQPEVQNDGDKAEYFQAIEGGNVQTFSILMMLQLRHSVHVTQGLEDCLTAKVPTPQEREIIEKEASQTQTASASPVMAPRRDRPAPRGAKCATGKASEGRKAQRGEKSMRKEQPKAANGREEDDWRCDVSAKGKLESSDGSWMAQQRSRRTTSDNMVEEKSDEEVLRTMKSILNKLTIEKFSVLSQKLISCGVRTTMHLETLINEVFEKATTQHHFINMYADLCTLLNAHFVEHPITDDTKMTFKRILLNGCQAFFERHLKPPADLDTLGEEDRTALERKYKTRMLGNIKFVGALLVRQMLASKVMFAILEELLREPLPETLESAAALLTIIGPKFDNPEWPLHAVIVSMFGRVTELSKMPSVNCRVRCLLKDVLELRSSKWQDRKPKQTEGPTTLKAVADSQAAEETAASHHGGGSHKVQKASGQAGMRVAPEGAKVVKRGAPPKATAPRGDYQRINSLAGLKERDTVPEQATSKKGESERRRKQPIGEQFDKDACLKEIFGALSELRISHEVKEATTRVSTIVVPWPQQGEVLCDMLGQIAEEGSQVVRKMYFELVAGLFLEGHWKAITLGKGLQHFVEEVYPDLKCDVPTLPQILRDELHPTLAHLVGSGMLKAAEHDLLAAL